MCTIRPSLLWGLILFWPTVSVAAVELPQGVLQEEACRTCHARRDASLVDAWAASAHGGKRPVAGCTACHGNDHARVAEWARQDGVCIECHGGSAEPAVHSYATSKHGLIVRLEGRAWDWRAPLRDGNYRTPGCAYCHLHAGEHDTGSGVRRDGMDPDTAGPLADHWRGICQECHAPRYVARWLETGERMLETARMKVREARRLFEQASARFGESDLRASQALLVTMQRHLRNVQLGIGHQSPDYQWWHGQPALDGDLLRIKGLLGELERRRRLSAAREEDEKR